MRTVVTNNADSDILIESVQDAIVDGAVVAGGRIISHRDEQGRLLGTTVEDFSGESSISISTGGALRLGRDLRTGSRISLSSGGGVTLGGDTHLSTSRQGSEIHLGGVGVIDVQAPAWIYQLLADGFAKSADGRLGGDVRFNVIDASGVSRLVTLNASVTASNTTLADLRADLQASLAVVGLNMDVRLRDGRLLLTSSSEFSIESVGAAGAERIGFDQLARGNAVAANTYTIDAAARGSVVTFGSVGDVTGSIRIAGRVRAYEAIQFHRAVSGMENQQFELTETGRLETISGDVNLRLGGSAVLRGVISAGGSLFVDAGTAVVAGETSIATFGTSSLVSRASGGSLSLIGLNDVRINSVIGGGNDELAVLRLESIEGTLYLDREAGRITTAAKVNLGGKSLVLDGVIETTGEPDADGFDIVLGAASIKQGGTLNLNGSIKFVSSGDIVLQNLNLLLNNPGQKLGIEAGGNIFLGTTDPMDGDATFRGVILQANTLLQLTAGGLIHVGSDAQLFSTADDSLIQLTATNVIVVGTVQAGARTDGANVSAWTGRNAKVEIETTEAVVVGGKGLDANFRLVNTGGTIAATGTVNIETGSDSDGIGLTVSSSSAIYVDASGSGALANTNTGQLTVKASGSVQLFGLVEGRDIGADVVIESDRLVFVDGLVRSNDSVTIRGGRSATGLGLLVGAHRFGSGGERLGGGTIDVAAGGRISLSADDGLLLNGIIGELGNGTPTLRIVTVESTGGAVSFGGHVNAVESITVNGRSVNVLENGRLKAFGNSSTITLRASEGVVLAGAVSDGAAPGTVDAPALVHLLAPSINVGGRITATPGTARVLLSGGNDVVISGLIVTGGDVDIHAGVDLGRPVSELMGITTIEGLRGGVVQVNGDGAVNAGGEIEVLAGDDFLVNAGVETAGQKTVRIPVIRTIVREFKVVAGYQQVAVGTIKVPEVVWVTTTVTEEIGQELVDVGDVFYTMTVTLERVGYYNPNAATGTKFREFFIEGIDYFNSADAAAIYGATFDAARVVNWALFGVNDTMTSDVTDTANYRGFGALNDAQRNTVLNTLGYKPLYDFSFANFNRHEVRGGQATVTDAAPTWLNNARVIYAVNADGLRDKFLRMPEGANQDVLRVESIGGVRFLTGDTTADGNNNGTFVSPTDLGATFEGYFNPDAVAANQVRTTFIEGQDYRNADINWAAYGLALATTETFADLSLDQRDAVADSLGYRPQYSATTAGGELVGVYRDEANLNYTQDRSRFDGTAGSLGDVPVGFDTADSVADFDNSGARWAVSYVPGTGERVLSIVDRNGQLSLLRAPDWTFNSVGFGQATDPIASNRFTQLILATNEFVSLLNSGTATLEEISRAGRAAVEVGSFGTFGEFARFIDETYDAEFGDESDDNGPNWEFDEKILDINVSDKDGNGLLNAEDIIEIRLNGQLLTVNVSDANANGVFDNDEIAKASVAALFAADSEFASGVNKQGARGALENSLLDYRQIRSESFRRRFGAFNLEDTLNLHVEGRNLVLQPITENQTDYTYRWVTTDSQVFDVRDRLTYNWVTQATDIFDFVPVTEQVTVTEQQTTLRDETVFQTQPITKMETELVTGREFDEASGIGSAFTGEAFNARGIRILVGRDVSVVGILTAIDRVEVNATRALTVRGLIAEGADFAAESRISAAISVVLTARDLTLADSLVEVTGTGSRIALTATADARLGGRIEANESIEVQAGRDVSLEAAMTAGNRIEISGGQAGNGSVAGNVFADLRTTAVGSDIHITAGEFGGDINLNGSLVTVAYGIRLSTPLGSVRHTGGLLVGELLTIRAFSGTIVRTDIARVDAVVSARGDISIDNVGAIELVDVTAADGLISVVAGGDVVATKVVSQGTGTGTGTGIVIRTRLVGATANLSFDTVSAAGFGDVTLDASGAITQRGGPLKADQITVKVNGGLTLAIDGNAFSLETRGSGDVAVSSVGTGNLLLDVVSILDGDLTVTALGTVELGQVTIATESSSDGSDDNVITIDTMGSVGAGDILVRFVGFRNYVETSNGSLARQIARLDNGNVVFDQDGEVLFDLVTVASIISDGDIVLRAKGRVTESSIDDDVDLIADSLTIHATSGVVGLEITVNELPEILTSGGDIQIADFDRTTEFNEGLIVGRVQTAQNAGTIVSITAANDLRLTASSNVRGDTIRLTSEGGNLEVVAPSQGDVLEYTRGIAFTAAETVSLYQFFAAPELIEYRAGVAMQFGTPGHRSSQIPGNLSAASIIIETGATLSIDGTLTATERLVLISDKSVFITGDIVAGDGDIDELHITARGGTVNIRTSGLDSVNFEIRAANDISISLTEDFALSGFVGGLKAFDPARNISLTTTGTLMVSGGIIAATEAIALNAARIVSDQSSVFIARDLTVQSAGDIVLSTKVDTITATVTGPGNIIIREADGVLLKRVVAADGRIDIAAGGRLDARYVTTLTDGTASNPNSILLATADNLYVDVVETAVNLGADKRLAEIVLDARLSIFELPGTGGAFDNSSADVYGYKVTIRDGTNSETEIVILTSPAVQGMGDDVEVLVTAEGDTAANVTRGTTTITEGNIDPMPVGDYVLIATGAPLQAVSVNAGGTLVVVQLPTRDGQVISLAAGRDLVLVSDLNVGSGMVNLSAVENLTLGGRITANTLTVTTGGDLTLDSSVNILHATATGDGDITINQTGDLRIASLTVNGGDVTIIVAGDVVIDSITGTIRNLTIVSTRGNITIHGNALADARSVTLVAADGSVQGTLPTGSLAVTAGGTIDLILRGNVVISVLVQHLAGASVSLSSDGDLTLNPALMLTGMSALSLAAGSDGSGSLFLKNAIISGTGTIALSGATGVFFIAEADIASEGGSITVTSSSGNVVMVGETVVSSGTGTIAISANGSVTLGKLRSTSSGELSITAGTEIIDAGDDAVDVIAPDASLVLVAATGIGSANAIETTVASVDLTNSTSGNVRISETDGLAVAGARQSGTGDIEILTNSGLLVVNSGTGIRTALGTVTLVSGSIELRGAIRTEGGAVNLAAGSGNITLAAGITVLGSGNISLNATRGAIVVGADAVGYLLKNGSFDSDADFALRQGFFSVDAITGGITLDDSGLTVAEKEQRFGPNTPATVILKSAGSAYLRTTAGSISLQAGGSIGQSVPGFRYSPLAVFIDAATVSAASSSGAEVVVTAVGTITLGGGESAGAGGNTQILTLTGFQRVDRPINGGGSDINLTGNDLDISELIRSVGGRLTIFPNNVRRTIVLGDDAGGLGALGLADALHLDLSELGRFGDGFVEIVFGSEEGAHVFYLGDPTTDLGQLNFRDPVRILSPARGGEVFIYDRLIGLGDASLYIGGSGSTTTLAADISMPGSIKINDSIKATGVRAINSGAGSLNLGGMAAHTIDGDGAAGNDLLSISADKNVTFTGTVGGVDPLEGIVIATSGDVHFTGDVTVHGDLTISASGNVRFDGNLNVTGTLTITGADSITFKAGVSAGGNIILAGNAIDFAGGPDSVVGTGSLTLRAKSVGVAIEIASPANPAIAGVLSIDSTDLLALGDGFSGITIGYRDVSGHAIANSGGVRLGAVEDAATFRDNVAIFGRKITLTDYANGARSVILAADLALDAADDIAIENEVTAVGFGISMISAVGEVKQKDDSTDGLTGERLVAATLSVVTHAGIKLTNIDAGTVSAANGGSGDIEIIHTGVGVVTLSTVTQSSQSGGRVIIGTTAAGLTVAGGVSVASGSVTLTVAGDLKSNGAVSTAVARPIVMSATGDLTLTGRISSKAGNITLTAGRDVAALADMDSVGGAISIASGRSIGMASGKVINAGAGNVTLIAGTSVNLSRIVSTGLVSVTATGGAISDQQAGEAANINADKTILNSGAGVGLGDDIDLNVSTVSARNSGTSGDITLHQVIGDRGNLTVLIIRLYA